ncbi:sugar phosphate isomerase/epimerase family protein [Pseudonocardia spinosispora]|uniref:sugar phosphate isomerase/epimerase family protein n=1 Tax=Pseudonocardia spinosispora TaxID=103441 RepID=UPI0004262D82|nr:sugar phosphate isomerase/epimerase family protein [Pseudonocardia spinosispora]
MSNKIGIHALVWVGGWSEREARHAISSSAAAGYDLIELAAIQPELFDADLTARLLAEHGLSAGVSLGLDDTTDVSSDDPDIVAAGRKRLDLALDLVRDVGGDYLGGVIFGKLGRYTTPLTERGRAHSVETIARLADRAAESGITLGLEFCNRYETNVLNTTEQTLAFIAETGRDNVVAHLDTYHMNIEETSFREPVLAAAAAGKLGYVHVGESHRGQLGTGSVPWAEFFEALHEVDYRGTITFESFSSEVVHPTLSSALSIWRNLWTDGMDLATGARAFLKQNYETR